MTTTPRIKTHRRYCLLKRLRAKRNQETALEAVWQGKQEAAPGDSLPTDFPLLSYLIAAGYSTTQDLDGADADELADAGGFTARESQAIFAALAPLLAA